MLNEGNMKGSCKQQKHHQSRTVAHVDISGCGWRRLSAWHRLLLAYAIQMQQHTPSQQLMPPTAANVFTVIVVGGKQKRCPGVPVTSEVFCAHPLAKHCQWQTALNSDADPKQYWLVT